MTKKISQAIIKVTVITLLIGIFLIVGVIYNNFIKMQFAQHKAELELAVCGVSFGGEKYLQSLNGENYRITWIDKNGNIIFDSKKDAEDMDNHIEREEFKLAQKNGYGTSSRISSTLSQKTLYSAKRLNDGSVLRISTTQLSVISLIKDILNSIIIIAILAVILSIFFAKKVAQKTVEPINNIDLENPLDNTQFYDELSPLLTRIHRQNIKINRQMSDLNRKNHEITYITENVTDGIILLNENGKVISANKKAVELLKCKIDVYYLDFCRNIDYRQTVEEALNDNSSSCIIKINDVNYRIHASNVKLDWGNMAVFIFINDITEEEKSQEMRRQFTANVSHELKTPLASIIGTAEIIKDGIVKQEDIPHFAQKIYEDAQRLLNLVQNIIKLSRLDEGNLSLELSTIELSDLCNQVKSELLDKAKANNIDINVECDKLYISAYPTTLHEMIYNLCDNAITYNKENGRVNISVKKENDSALLSISDTGIGIAKENIPHIFERFYCVDKSHSKKKGGTGLGLSIVKHAAKMNNAEISIESELDVGTTITVKFPLHEKSL